MDCLTKNKKQLDDENRICKEEAIICHIHYSEILFLVYPNLEVRKVDSHNTVPLVWRQLRALV